MTYISVASLKDLLSFFLSSLLLIFIFLNRSIQGKQMFILAIEYSLYIKSISQFISFMTKNLLLRLVFRLEKQ